MTKPFGIAKFVQTIKDLRRLFTFRGLIRGPAIPNAERH